MSQNNWAGDPSLVPVTAHGIYSSTPTLWAVYDDVFDTLHIENVSVEFEPQPYITAYELALLQKINCSPDSNRGKQIEELNLTRHYKVKT